MSAPKLQISSPLEAGQSLLGFKNLPAPLTTALEYISSRLAKKQMTLSMIVVRKDTQAAEPSSPPQSAATSPARSVFNTASSSKRPLSRSSSFSSISSSSSSSSSPSSPRSSYSSPELGCTSPTSPNPYGISLIHACTFTPKEEKVLRHYVAKAEKKFRIGTGWLSAHPLTTAITCARTNDMIRRSLNQNSVLFSSEGLTLYELDHVYTFKCQLHNFSRSLSYTDLVSATDELHRLVLTQNGRRITRGYLMRAYNWLGVSHSALIDVNQRYKIAYGGPQQLPGIHIRNEENASPPPLKTRFNVGEIKMLGSMRENQMVLKPLSVRSGRRLVEDGGPQTVVRPTAPNTWEDVTPVTKGEWLCLMVGEGWEKTRPAGPVVSCLN